MDLRGDSSLALAQATMRQFTPFAPISSAISGVPCPRVKLKLRSFASPKTTLSMLLNLPLRWETIARFLSTPDQQANYGSSSIAAGAQNMNDWWPNLVERTGRRSTPPLPRSERLLPLGMSGRYGAMLWTASGRRPPFGILGA